MLGLGGMGVVYAAKHELLNNAVALKLLLPEVAKDKEAVARFVHEGRATARLQSPHVVRVMDVGMAGEAPFLVMELLSGVDLSQLLSKKGKFLITETVDYLLEAMEGLSHAHAAGIIHRDLKPSNLFLANNEDETHTIKVVDFGISKSMGANSGNITSTAAVLGSPAYMAPEQLRSSKRVDARADIWSLGVIAFELLTGTIPFDGETVGEIFANVLQKAPTRPRQLRVEVPGQLEEAIIRCLQKSPDERFPNVGELAGAIARYGTGRCDPIVASIEKRFGALGASVLPVRAPSSSVPDLGVSVRAGAVTISAPPTSGPKLPPAPISSPMASGSFDFDESDIGPTNLVTWDEASKPRTQSRPVVSRPPPSTTISSMPPLKRAPIPASAHDMSWVVAAVLHAVAMLVVLGVLRRFVTTEGGWHPMALLPTEGAPCALVGGVLAIACIATGVYALKRSSPSWGLAIIALGLFAMAVGMLMVAVSTTDGLSVATLGPPIIALGAAVLSLTRARNDWLDGERLLPPVLALAAGGLVFCALQLAGV